MFGFKVGFRVVVTFSIHFPSATGVARFKPTVRLIRGARMNGCSGVNSAGRDGLLAERGLIVCE